MLDFIKYFFIVLLSLVLLIILFTLINIVILFFKGKRRKKFTKKPVYKKRSLLLKFFYDLPKALARDFYAKNPDTMKIHGLYIFCGTQGSGKTIAAVQFLREMIQRYPLIHVRSNIDIAFQDGGISHWYDIINVHNGEIGQIDFLDEIQNWFSSNDSRNFPPQMLQEVTQERKKHKVIAGTSQVFTRMSKPLREQTTFLCYPTTFFGCLTVVRVYKPEVDDSGTLVKRNFIRMYCFVHDDELRSAYDTYHRVESLGKAGLQAPPDMQD